MDPNSSLFSMLLFLIIPFLPHLSQLQGTRAATFTLINNCDRTIWPGVLSNAGSAKLVTTGFELPQGSSNSLQAPTGWSGRFWARTSCQFDSSGRGTCVTGDCGSGTVECNGAGAAPPATLAEFTLGTAGGKDFYDVSLVDGYNLPMLVAATSGETGCGTTGCVVDLNTRCPSELRVMSTEEDGSMQGVAACRSACEAFGKPEFCCSGAYANPNTCKPSSYSNIFKTACPRAYSYAYDDATSTFTCADTDYTITFCPSLPSSQKSSKEPSPPRTTGTAGVILSDEGWLASLATTDPNSQYSISSSQRWCPAGLWCHVIFLIASLAVSYNVIL